MEIHEAGRRARRYFAVFRRFPTEIEPEESPGKQLALRQALPFFPAIALAFGFTVAVLDNVFQLFLPLPVVSALTVVYLVVVSGGRNMKGVALSAEGFFNSQPRERTLEIMRDPRFGVTGMLALVSVFALKLMALASLKANDYQPWARWGVLLLVPLWGRLGMLHMVRRLIPSRKESSLSLVFRLESRPLPIYLGYGAAFVLGFFFLGLRGAFVGLIAPLCADLLCLYCRSRIGGFTNETLAAACELQETVTLVAVTMLQGN